ncbi:MAG: biopolymer transporter ExbD [Methylobacillus sp.]|jgi:biopolymer transport protein ExbD|nr:biopolymer transporter ExbD [Methylobacillus sp.]
MNFQRGRKHEDLEMSLIPLIDVLLVIIIFLVVGATFSRIHELNITLPTAEAAAPEEKPNMVTVGIDASGRYSINRVDLADGSVESIVAALQKAVGDSKDPVIVVSADANSTHQSVINVMEAAREAGYTHITFATQAKGS